jgi:hypothetical protein
MSSGAEQAPASTAYAKHTSLDGWSLPALLEVRKRPWRHWSCSVVTAYIVPHGSGTIVQADLTWKPSVPPGELREHLGEFLISHCFKGVREIDSNVIASA